MAPDDPDEARAGPAEHHECVSRRLQGRRLCRPAQRVRGAGPGLRKGVSKVLGEAQARGVNGEKKGGALCVFFLFFVVVACVASISIFID